LCISSNLPVRGVLGVDDRVKAPVLRSKKKQIAGKNSENFDQQGRVKGAKFIRVRHGETRHAAYHLAQTKPLYSAASGLVPGQVLFLALLFGAIIFGLVMNFSLMLQIFRLCLLGLFGFIIAFRGLLLVVHFWPKPKPDMAQTTPKSWPLYTILLPVYREARILPKLVEAIANLNYPRARLDIKLLLEADDEETLRAARRLHLDANWEVLIVPNIGPRTKPKALNVGLHRARGSLVTIYDAEDRPHPDQLQAAVCAFAKDEDDLACVQAPLGYYNASQNWLTQQFSLEYNAQFRVVLPALVRLGLAFPLGGTSNHFRKIALDECGGWDPYNVTEDADLGFRLAAYGWRSDMILPPTLEEATAGLLPWIGQRSRWIKGFVQTLFVHLRGTTPGGRPKHAFGFFASLGVAVVSAFSHGLLLLATMVCLVCWPLGGQPPALPDAILAACGTLLAWGLLACGHIAAKDRTSWHIDPVLIISSLAYWPLQTWAALLAIKDLLVRPFHWEKTAHGHSFAHSHLLEEHQPP